MSEASKSGRYVERSVAGSRYRAFIPPPLLPVPEIGLNRLQVELEKAATALGRLDGLVRILPDTPLFLYFYVRKEAVLSSQIEGTQSSLSDLLLFESEEVPGVPVDDVTEVSNYVAALNHGLRRIRDGFPLSVRLLREIHEVLLRTGRGSDKTPGEFRRAQNWIGGEGPSEAIYVPPPPELVPDCMAGLERFLHDEETALPVLVRAALAHVQFESIHPFLDGNGRVGRLLIVLLLCSRGELSEPVLYLSLYLKKRRSRYYELLQTVREESGWEEWLRFFLTGVAETAVQAAETVQRVLDLFHSDRERIRGLGRPAASALQVHERLQFQPLLSIPKTAEALNLSSPTVASALNHLEELGIVREVTGRSRNRVFAYSDYISILNEGTEPLPRG